MIQNTREETSLFYLFSNDHVPKELIEHDFDFDDEEVLAYYISFLKTVSLKLNPRTIQFFFTGADNGTRRSRREPQHRRTRPVLPPRSPLPPPPPTTTTTRTRVFRCTSARRDFSPIPRAMVRAAARTAVLNCAGTPDVACVAGYCPLARGRRARLGRGARRGDDGGAYGRDAGRDERWTRASERSNLVAELVDLLHYVDDPASVPDPSERTGGEVVRDAPRRSCGRDSWNPR